MYINDVDYDTFIVQELFVDLHYCEPKQTEPVNSSVYYINESIRANEWFDTQVPVTTSGLTNQHLSAKSDALVKVTQSNQVDGMLQKIIMAGM